jgi:hypothetical protein
VAKLSVTVDLLLGNIPERTSFLLPGLKAALAPYLQLAQVFSHFKPGLRIRIRMYPY